MRATIRQAMIAATAITALTAGGSASSAAPATLTLTHHREHACLAQMRVLREVSREAGITIGSAFLGPSRYPSRPRLWHRQLDRAGLWAAGRAAARISDIPTNQAFVRVMTDTAASILDGRARCTGGLPLT